MILIGDIRLKKRRKYKGENTFRRNMLIIIGVILSKSKRGKKCLKNKRKRGI
jgi:hypothetical protein